MNIEALKQPFSPDKISWRIGATNGEKTSAIALAYIDARDVMERLDEVCGIGGWQALYPHANGKTSCKIGLKIGEEWVWKENGAGDSDVEAEKGAFSDAFKRAAVLWGIGRYLYDVANIWVDIAPMGRSFKIKNPKDPKLAKALEDAAKGIRAAPEDNKFSSENKSIQAAIFTKIGMCKDETELLSVMDETKIQVDALPEEMSSLIDQEINNRLDAYRKGIAIVPITKHRFAGVEDAIAWATRMKPVIEGFKSTKLLTEWQAHNQPWIEGLDCLKAEKYTKDDKSFKQRFTDALKAKYELLSNIELSQSQIAAE